MKAVLTLMFAGLAGGMMGLGTNAMAQTAPDPASPQTIPEQGVAQPHTPGMNENEREGRSLSDQLDTTHGVIKPAPGTDDPAMVKPAPVPEPNSTPVIPPPGTPGGPPGGVPK